MYADEVFDPAVPKINNKIKFLLLKIRYEAECMVSGEHTFLLLALLYQPGVSSVGDEADVFKVIFATFQVELLKKEMEYNQLEIRKI